MTDEQVRSARFHVWIATVLVFVFIAHFRATSFDAFMFGFSLIMLGPFIYGPAAIIFCAVSPTYRLRLFWAGLLLPIALGWMFWQMPDQDLANRDFEGLFGWTMMYFIGWSIALAMPEFTLVGRYFPYLRFVDADFFKPPPRKGFS